ncbi:MAG: esterase/lipase family protein [Oceanococcus sp.]
MKQAMGPHARAFFIAMCVELGLYALYLGNGVLQGRELLPMLGRVLIIFVSIRAVMVAANFLQTWLARSVKAPEHQIGALASIKLYFNELYSALWTYPFLFALEPWLVRNAPQAGLPHKGLPIVLVPGFLCNRGYYGKFRRFLAKNGYGNVWAVTLEPVFGSIDDNARHLGELIEQICQETGEEQVILIGHSMGGVVARSYIDKQGGAKRIAHAIALGSPFGGTVLAKGPSGLGENLRQMIVGCDWLQELAAYENQACPTRFTAIWSPHDSIVAPQNGTKVSEVYGHSIAMPGIGHMEMIVSMPVLNQVLQVLDSKPAAARA